MKYIVFVKLTQQGLTHFFKSGKYHNDFFGGKAHTQMMTCFFLFLRILHVFAKKTTLPKKGKIDPSSSWLYF